MARKRYKPEEIISLLRQAEVLHGQGMSMADAIRLLGISEVTYYLYGRLSRCKRCWSQRRGSVANIYPASPVSGCPNGESARTRLYSWQASKTSIILRLVARRSDLCSSFRHRLATWWRAFSPRRGRPRHFEARPR